MTFQEGSNKNRVFWRGRKKVRHVFEGPWIMSPRAVGPNLRDSKTWGICLLKVEEIKRGRIKLYILGGWGPLSWESWLSNPLPFYPMQQSYIRGVMCGRPRQEMVKNKSPIFYHLPTLNLLSFFNSPGAWKIMLKGPVISWIEGEIISEKENKCVSKVLLAKMRGFCVWCQQFLPWIAICNTSHWLINTRELSRS